MATVPNIAGTYPNKQDKHYPMYPAFSRLNGGMFYRDTGIVRTAEEKQEEIISVQDFGTVGTSDDTLVIQKAIDYMGTRAVNGRPVGILSLNGLRMRHHGLTITKPVNIEGAGAELYALPGTTGGELFISVTSSYDYVTQGWPYGLVNLANFTVRGAGKSDTGGSHAIYVNDTGVNDRTFSIHAYNIVTFNQAGHGLYQVQGGHHSKWINCTFWNCGQRAVYLNSTADSRFVNCEIGVAEDWCLVVSGCTECRFTNTYIYAGGEGGVLNYNSTGHFTGCSFDRNMKHGFRQTGTSGVLPTFLYDCNFGLNSRATSKTYDDLSIESGTTHPVHMFGCVFEDPNKVNNNVRNNIHFDGNGTVYSNACHYSAGGITATDVCNSPSKLLVPLGPHIASNASVNSAITMERPVQVNITQQYTGFVMKNNAGQDSATIKAYGANGGAGTLELFTSAGVLDTRICPDVTQTRLRVPGTFADDAAAAAAGIPVGYMYRKTGGTIAWRVS